MSTLNFHHLRYFWAVAKEGGYTYVLNQAVGAGIPSILYGKESDNLTEAIAKRLGIAVEE